MSWFNRTSEFELILANQRTLLANDAVLIAQQKALQTSVNLVFTQEKQQMLTDQQALDLLTKIDTATTAQAQVLATESTTLQTISDEIDALISKATASGVSDVVAAALQAQADKVAAISDSIQKQSDFSAAIATKGADNPVPVPVPPATPAP